LNLIPGSDTFFAFVRETQISEAERTEICKPNELLQEAISLVIQIAQRFGIKEFD
jgi:hypothetical protein